MRTYVPLAIVGVAACVAVYAINQNQSATSLFTPMTVQDHAFMAHVAKHGRSFGTKEEFEYRSNVFKDNLDRINKINSENGNTFSVASNKFADWTKTEYKKLLGTKKSTGAKNIVELEETAIPASLDWRTKGVVQNVKDQGQCGSCWAFSGIGALESAHAIKTGKLLSLSEQQIVDCATGGRFQSQGCDGGFMYEVFQYAEKVPVELESAYPYKGVDGSCKAKGGNVEDTNFRPSSSDPSLLLLKPTRMSSSSTTVESSTPLTAEPRPITESSPSDMVDQETAPTTSSRTHGAHHGERVDTSKSLQAKLRDPVSAVSRATQPTPLAQTEMFEL
jgi:hypothetical protein